MTDWDRIVREYGSLVFATAWRILGHAADTEDIVQEVFLQVHQLQQSHAVRHWPGLLRRLAACRALDRLRSAGPLSRLTACRWSIAMRDRKRRPSNMNWPSGCGGPSPSCRIEKRRCSVCVTSTIFLTRTLRIPCTSEPAPWRRPCTRLVSSWNQSCWRRSQEKT